MNRISPIAAGFLKVTLAVCIIRFGTSTPSLAELVVYPAPSGTPLSTRFTATVNGQALSVHDARISDPLNCSFVSFDMDEPAAITITVPSGFSSVTIRPKPLHIPFTTNGNTITFSISSPVKLALTLNRSIRDPLYIFANPIETNKPKQGDPGILYYGPGIHNLGTVRLSSNQTVYLAGGAIVNAIFRAYNADNIAIRGRGIIDAHDARDPRILMSNCRNVLVEGITITDQPTRNWTMPFYKCDSVRVENIKEMSGDHWSNDGINLCSCINSSINDCFIQTYDDAITIKTPDSTNGANSENILVTNCFLWVLWAHGISVGAETKSTYMRDMLFKNIDIVMANVRGVADTYNGALGIFHDGNSTISNIRFEDIRIEGFYAENRMIQMIITPSKWTDAATRGRIRDVYFKNVILIDDWGKGWSNRIQGYDDSHKISNVTFENLMILGKVILSPEQGNFDIDPDTTYNIQFVLTGSQRPTVHYGFEGDALDSVGDNHGIIYGANFVPGQFGSLAAHFDGVDDYIEIPSVVSDYFTIAFWVRTTSKAGSGRWTNGNGLVDGTDVHSREDFGTALVGSKLGFGVGWPRARSGNVTITSTTDINDGQWHHVAATRNAITGEMKIYVDGVEEANSVGPTWTKDASSVLRVGCLGSGLNFFEGDIDDLYLYGYVLGAEQLAYLIDTDPYGLSGALDTTLGVTTGGDEEWFFQTATSYYDGDAAQSGDISNNQESWMQTTVSGPTTVDFYWKVSSEAGFDFLEFYIDGVLQDQISGSRDWEQKIYTIPLGSHTLEWRYVKDSSTSSGTDCGWVDKVDVGISPPPTP